jgi:hypothetical protein
MKAKIEITDGFVGIVLTAENSFEKTMIEDLEREQPHKQFGVKARTDTRQYTSDKINHRIYIDINEKPIQK